MIPEELQDPNIDMTPEEAKASLGLSTRLTEQYLMSQMPQEPMGEEEVDMETGDVEETVEEPVEEVEDPLVSLEERLTQKIEEMGEKLKKSISGDNDEVESLKKEIEKVLNEDE